MKAKKIKEKSESLLLSLRWVHKRLRKRRRFHFRSMWVHPNAYDLIVCHKNIVKFLRNTSSWLWMSLFFLTGGWGIMLTVNVEICVHLQGAELPLLLSTTHSSV